MGIDLGFATMGGGLCRCEGPVGPVSWPAGPLAQLARGPFLYFSFLFFYVFYFFSVLFCSSLYFSFVKYKNDP